MPTELERDLTELLHHRATQTAVDPEAAFTEHRRRLRVSKTRQLAALAVGALAVLAGPTLLFVHHPQPAQSSTARPSSNAVTPIVATPTFFPTFRIADFTARGETWVAWAMFKKNCLYVQATPAGQPADGSPQYVGGSIECPLTVRDPTVPLILQGGVLDQGDGSDQVNSSPLPDLSVWVTTANVARLDITLADRQTVSTRLIGTDGTLNVFLCDHNIKYYRADTYYDAAGHQIYRDTTPFDK